MAGFKKMFHKVIRAAVTRKQYSEVRRQARGNKETVADFVRRAIDNELTR